MLGREMVVISGWVGQGENALSGNGKIPLGSLCLRLLTSSIFQVGLGGGSMLTASFVVKRGYGGRLLFWYGGRFNSIRGTVGLLWPEFGLWAIGLMVPVL